ncbi:hypothetical protein [Aquimarina rhabdastrellae]
MRFIFTFFCLFIFVTKTFSQIPNIRERSSKITSENTLDDTSKTFIDDFILKKISSSSDEKKLIPSDLIDASYYDYFSKQIKLTKKNLKKEIEQQKAFLKKNKNLETLLNQKVDSLSLFKSNITKIKDSIKVFRLIKNKIARIAPSRSWLPTISTRGRENTFNSLYSKDDDDALYFANDASLLINNDGAIVKSEITSAYLGPLRIGFGTIITNSNSETDDTSNDNDGTQDNDSDQNAAFQRLIAGGGNTFLNVELPLFFYKDNRFLFYLNSNARFALEISEFSNDVDTTTGNGSLNSNFYASVSTDDDKFNFFFYANLGWYFGSNEFYNRLNIVDEKAFSFGELTAGVTISRNLKFALTFNTFGSEENLRSGNVLIGAQILPELFRKD